MEVHDQRETACVSRISHPQRFDTKKILLSLFSEVEDDSKVDCRCWWCIRYESLRRELPSPILLVILSVVSKCCQGQLALHACVVCWRNICRSISWMKTHLRINLNLARRSSYKGRTDLDQSPNVRSIDRSRTHSIVAASLPPSVAPLLHNFSTLFTWLSKAQDPRRTASLFWIVLCRVISVSQTQHQHLVRRRRRRRSFFPVSSCSSNGQTKKSYHSGGGPPTTTFVG
jgi:hypothetical protein